MLLAPAPPARAEGPLDDLRWLAGTWERVLPDSHAVETWGTPHGQTMVGMFQLTEGDQVQFVELQTIRVEKNDVVLRILHASPDLIPFQDERSGPLRYVALSVKPGEAVFGNTQDDVKQIIYRRQDNGDLLVRLVKVAKGKTRHIDFRFQRRRPPGAPLTGSGDVDARCRGASGDHLVATDCCAPVPW